MLFSFQTCLKTLMCCAFVALPSFLLAGENEIDPQQASWHKKYIKQQNVPKDPNEMLLNIDKEPDLTKGFKPLFNGKDLTGWSPQGGTCTFEVQDGAILGTTVKGSNSTYLCTERDDFKDFVFTCEMKWVEQMNSGVMFRAKSKPGKKDSVTVYGPQAEMEGYAQDRHWSGGIYGQSCGGYFYPLWLTAHKEVRAAMKPQGEWNRITIATQGNTVKTWLNGVPAAHWEDDGTYAQGFFGLQIHKGSGGKVLWRDIKVKEM